MHRFRTSYLGSSLAFVLVGLALLLWPGLSIRVVCLLFGVVILAKGLASLWSAWNQPSGLFRYWNFTFGIAAGALGVFLLVQPSMVVSVLPIVVGLFVIFDGLMRLESAISLKQAGYSRWWGFLALALLSVVLGVVMLVNPFATVEVLVMAIGFILLLEGVLNLAGAIYVTSVMGKLEHMMDQQEREMEQLMEEAQENRKRASRHEKQRQEAIDVEYWPSDEE